MAKESLKKGIGIPEWCLYAYVSEPSSDEVDATAAFIRDNPDIAKLPTVVQDATLSLIARDSTGKRIWNDADIPLLARRQRDTIARVISNYGPVANPVLAAIEKCLNKTAPAKGKDNGSAK